MILIDSGSSADVMSRSFVKDNKIATTGVEKEQIVELADGSELIMKQTANRIKLSIGEYIQITWNLV